MLVIVIVPVLVIMMETLPIALDFMTVGCDELLDAEQSHHAKGHPPAKTLLARVGNRVGHHVKEGRPQHDAGRRTQVELQPTMRNSAQERQTTAEQRHEHDEPTVQG